MATSYWQGPCATRCLLDNLLNHSLKCPLAAGGAMQSMAAETPEAFGGPSVHLPLSQRDAVILAPYSLHLCHENGQYELIGRAYAQHHWQLVPAQARDTFCLSGSIVMFNFEVCSKYRGMGYGRVLLGVVERHALDVFGVGAHVVAWNCTKAGRQFFTSQGFKKVKSHCCWYKPLLD